MEDDDDKYSEYSASTENSPKVKGIRNIREGIREAWGNSESDAGGVSEFEVAGYSFQLGNSTEQGNPNKKQKVLEHEKVFRIDMKAAR